MRLVYVNRDLIAYEKDMADWLERIVAGGLCVSCEDRVTDDEWIEWSLGGRVVLEHVRCSR